MKQMFINCNNIEIIEKAYGGNSCDKLAAKYNTKTLEEIQMFVPAKIIAFLSDFNKGQFSDESLVMLLYPLLKKEEIDIDDIATITGISAFNVMGILDNLDVQYYKGLTKKDLREEWGIK